MWDSRSKNDKSILFLIYIIFVLGQCNAQSIPLQGQLEVTDHIDGLIIVLRQT